MADNPEDVVWSQEDSNTIVGSWYVSISRFSHNPPAWDDDDIELTLRFQGDGILLTSIEACLKNAGDKVGTLPDDFVIREQKLAIEEEQAQLRTAMQASPLPAPTVRRRL